MGSLYAEQAKERAARTLAGWIRAAAPTAHKLVGLEAAMSEVVEDIFSAAVHQSFAEYREDRDEERRTRHA